MVAVSFGGYAVSLFIGDGGWSGWDNVFISGLLIVMGVLNAIGTKAVAAAATALLVGVVAVFGVFIFVTVPHIDTSLLAFDGYPSASKIIASVALTFFAFLGFNVLTFTAGDLKNPRRDLPRAMALSLGITTVIYVLIAIGVFGTLTVPEVIGYGETAIAEAARPQLGDAGFTIMAVAALLATAGCTNATLYASNNLTRMLAEMRVFPSFFGQAHRSAATPVSTSRRRSPCSSRTSATSARSLRSAAPSRWSSSCSSAPPAGGGATTPAVTR